MKRLPQLIPCAGEGGGEEAGGKKRHGSRSCTPLRACHSPGSTVTVRLDWSVVPSELATLYAMGGTWPA